MLNLIWDLHQQSRIGSLESGLSEARNAAKAAESVQRDLKLLESRVDALALTNVALWSLLQEKLGLTEQQLADRIEEIDLRDGVRDGRIGPADEPCPKCGRRKSFRHKRCLFCGSGGS